MFDDEEQKDRAEEYIIGLQKIASPDLRRMVGQEGRPRLSSVPRRDFSSSLVHVTSDGASVDLQAEFEQLTPNALGSLSPILNCYPLDQSDGLFIDPR